VNRLEAALTPPTVQGMLPEERSQAVIDLINSQEAREVMAKALRLDHGQEDAWDEGMLTYEERERDVVVSVQDAECAQKRLVAWLQAPINNEGEG